MPVGRPNSITKEVLRKLEEAFSVGATDLEACHIANISKTTLYDYQNKNPEFTERKEGLKQMLKYQARVNISKQIKNGDPKISSWYLERKSKNEFGTRVNLNQEISYREKPIFTPEQKLRIAVRIAEDLKV